MSGHDSVLSARAEPPAPDSTRPFGQRELDAIRNGVTAVSIANQRTMPTVATVIDQLRAVFGSVEVIFVEEAGHKLGKMPDPGVIAHPPHVPGKSRKRRQ